MRIDNSAMILMHQSFWKKLLPQMVLIGRYAATPSSLKYFTPVADALELVNAELPWMGQVTSKVSSQCPAPYTLVVFDGTWQEAREIAKVSAQIPVCVIVLASLLQHRQNRAG